MIFDKMPNTDFDGNRKLFPKKPLELILFIALSAVTVLESLRLWII